VRLAIFRKHAPYRGHDAAKENWDARSQWTDQVHSSVMPSIGGAPTNNLEIK